MHWALLAVVLAAAPAPGEAAEQEHARRLNLRVGEQQRIASAPVDAVLSIDERVAGVNRTADGFTVVARTTGDTIIQAFGAAGLTVYVVTVTPAPPPPPGPPPPPTIGQHGPINTFWADNRYSLRFTESSNSELSAQHLFGFHGRVRGGEYQAGAQLFTTEHLRQLQFANVLWTSDRRDTALELGDTSARLFGSQMLGGVGLRGFRASRTYALGGQGGGNEWGHEVFAGELRGVGDPNATGLDQPAVGANVTTSYTPASMRDLRITAGASAFGFSSASTTAGLGQSGVLLGAFGRAVHKRGFALELKTALSSTAAHQPGAPLTTAGSFGVVAQYQDDVGLHRVEYDGNQPGFALPQSSSNAVGVQRMSASFSRRVHGIVGAGNASFARTEDLQGHTLDGLSYRFSVTAPMNGRTSFALTGGQNNTAVLSPLDGTGQMTLRPWSQGMLGARLDHASSDDRYGVQSEVAYTSTEAQDSSALGTTASLAVQRRRRDNWEASGIVSFSASQLHARSLPSSTDPTSVLAVDQPPLTLGASVGLQARRIQGPFESFGGLGLQATMAPVTRMAPTVNIGVQFTPTSAHQLIAAFNLSRWLTGGQWNHTTAVNYTYHFGDAVRATPLFEFMSFGVVEGRVCFDENSDGVCAPSEPPIADVPLRLSDGSTTRTDERGRYRFERVKPGYYHVDVDEDAAREHGRPTTILAAAFDLPVRGTETHDFGVARSCRIRGHLVNDLDLDGRRGDQEPLFGSGQVVLSGVGGRFPVRVNNLGTFSVMAPCGEYLAEIDAASLPALWSPSGVERVRVNATPTDIPTAELFVRAVRTIAGDVFVDTNHNGTKDEGEPVVTDAVVRFADRAGSSDETGAFLLRNVPAGAAQLVVDPASLPQGLRPTAPIPLTIQQDPAALEDVHVPVAP